MKRTITNEFGETVVTMDSMDRGPLTEEEREMIRQMDDIDDEYDEDCPPMPEAMIIQMQNDIKMRRHARMARGAQASVRHGSGTVSTACERTEERKSRQMA